MSEPTGKIILAWREDGVRWRVEKLDKPVLRGAGLREYRLWRDNYPASGGQWHYTIEGALWRAEYEMHCRYSDKLNAAILRINILEKANFLLRHELNVYGTL